MVLCWEKWITHNFVLTEAWVFEFFWWSCGCLAPARTHTHTHTHTHTPAQTGPLGSFLQTQTLGHAEIQDQELFAYELWPFGTSSNVLTDGFLIVFQGWASKDAGGGKQTRDLKAREWQNRKISNRFFYPPDVSKGKICYSELQHFSRT